MLDNIKLLLGIASDNEDRDELLELIIRNTTARLKVLCGGADPGKDLDYIVQDVSIIRYNRIGSEGMTSHTVDGESNVFVDSDFDSYAGDIAAWLEKQESGSRGKLRFL